MDITKLIELDSIAKESVKKYTKFRNLFYKLTNSTGKHFVGIVGPRGVGKTILLKQLANHYKDTFYISVDTIDEHLFEIIKKLNETLKIKNFFLDEVHTYKNFDKELKMLYDVFETKNIKIFLTSSTALGMYKSKYDLSRRLVLKTLYPFSFIEYINFKYNKKIDYISSKDICNKELPIQYFKYSQYFYSYLKGELMPFALQEPDVLPLLKNILETVINKDIPKIEPITIDEIEIIKKLVKFIALSTVDGINYTSISNNLKITKYKAEQYLSLLERAFIIYRVFPKGTNVLKEPKVLMALPYRLLYKNFTDCIGALREDFFISTFSALNKKVFYLKSTTGKKTADYILEDNEDIAIEIGGKSKGKSQFKGLSLDKKIILADSIENNTKDKKPLFSIGFIS